MTEEMVVENLLSEWPIKERQEERQLNALVATLLNGEKRLVEFEKTIVPANVVGRYIVVEHTFPLPGIPSARHYAKEVGTYDEYGKADEMFYRKAQQVNKDATDEDGVSQILLVGELKGKQLDFNSTGVPNINTGIILGCMLTNSYKAAIAYGDNDLGLIALYSEIAKIYPNKEPPAPNLPVTINNKLYVSLEREGGTLKFEQSVLQGNELDVAFWKVDPEKDISRKQYKNGADEDFLLHKRKKREDMTTEQWVVDRSLLSKRGSKGQGNGIT